MKAKAYWRVSNRGIGHLDIEVYVTDQKPTKRPQNNPLVLIEPVKGNGRMWVGADKVKVYKS